MTERARPANNPAMPSPVAWSRPEPFGAWVRFGDELLVAVDHALAERLGVPHGDGAAGADSLARDPRPLELHVAVTSRCPARCDGCYADARPEGPEPSFAELLDRLRDARDRGVSTVAFGGGEPLVRRDLGELAAAARALGLVPVLTTSGIGLGPERVRSLRAFAQINVSHDGEAAGYESVRGFDGRRAAEAAIAMLAGEGIAVGVNMVLTRSSFGALEATAARVAELGARELQLLRYKPAGRARGLAYLDRRLAPAQVGALFPAIRAIARGRRLRVRIDCALVPLLSKALLEGEYCAPGEAPTQVLSALGVLGCEAGRHLGAVTADGAAGACSFLAPPAATGARLAPSLPLAPDATKGADDASGAIRAIRAHHAAPGEPCRSCPLGPICRGGCQVVSLEATGRFGPDPECPRVREHAARIGASAEPAAPRRAIEGEGSP